MKRSAMSSSSCGPNILEGDIQSKRTRIELPIFQVPTNPNYLIIQNNALPLLLCHPVSFSAPIMPMNSPFSISDFNTTNSPNASNALQALDIHSEGITTYPVRPKARPIIPFANAPVLPKSSGEANLGSLASSNTNSAFKRPPSASPPAASSAPPTYSSAITSNSDDGYWHCSIPDCNHKFSTKSRLSIKKHIAKCIIREDPDFHHMTPDQVIQHFSSMDFDDIPDSYKAIYRRPHLAKRNNIPIKERWICPNRCGTSFNKTSTKSKRLHLIQCVNTTQDSDEGEDETEDEE